MTADEAAFLRAIIAAPDDDLPRLIYADWLDERGDPRGEFIRLQIERERGNVSVTRYRQIVRREEALLKKNRDRLLLSLPAGCEQRTRRGFVDRVECDAKELLCIEPNAFEFLPPPELRVNEFDAWYVGEVAGLPIFDQIRALEVFDASFGDGGIVGIVRGSRLSKLRVLELMGTSIGLGGLRALADEMPHAGLTLLNLSNNPVTDEGVTALADSRQFAKLECLSLAQRDATPYAIRLHAVSAGTIARSHYLTRLTRLDLSHNAIGDGGLASLAMSGNCSSLDTLNLRDNDLCATGDVAIERLCESPYLDTLTHLDLCRNPLSRKARRLLRRRFGDVVSM